MITKTGVAKALLVPSVVLGMLVTSSAAMAAQADEVVEQGMNLTGFDPAVAQANGYKIVTYANGEQQSVPIDESSALPKSEILRPGAVRQPSVPKVSEPASSTTAAANPTDYNEVRGNCGVSWIRVTKTGSHKVTLVSGFKQVPYTAVDWSWTVSLSDRNGTSHQTAGGVMAGTSASRIWQNLNQYGWTFDYVASGTAILINGSICTSGHPDVSLNL